MPKQRGCSATGGDLEIAAPWGLPLGELFGEGAVFAVGDVLEAEVLVDLEEGLLLPEFFVEGSLVPAPTEEAGGGAADGVAGGAAGELEEGLPGGGGVGEGPTGDVIVAEEFVGAGCAEEGDGAGSLLEVRV